ncbi:hypothetical protein Acr_12g0001440 [Actinidia rufa]|uniref:F-box associated beta-propeller type 3 domain-containing protein n=1 Tax=Actinidia rufa TaxID=165716 RepID=A0A7J0FG80_9ERIC|nr:hypothetical protein Acr_12g0001440 [Actinidia rufa]
MYICNPCTGKYVKIPPPVSMADQPGDIVVGFGLVPVTHKYKVIAIVDCPETSMFNPLQQKGFVYTLGDASWRFKDNESILSIGKSASKAFVNGALHWVSNCASKLIVSFNIASELFGVVPHPQLQLGRGSFSSRVFERQLSILNTSFDARIEIGS